MQVVLPVLVGQMDVRWELQIHWELGLLSGLVLLDGAVFSLEEAQILRSL